MKAEEITKRLTENFPGAKIQASDLTGGGDHWSVTIEAREFSGLSLVEQHQLVYRALGDWMRGPIHALALNTKATP